MSKSNEAFWWSLFSAGGVVAALCLPAIIVISGFVLPTASLKTGADRYRHIYQVLQLWPARIILFVIIFLSLFHCAHRLRHTLMDLGLRRVEGALMGLCYGGALAATVWTAVVLLRL